MSNIRKEIEKRLAETVLKENEKDEKDIATVMGVLLDGLIARGWDFDDASDLMLRGMIRLFMAREDEDEDEDEEDDD